MVQHADIDHTGLPGVGGIAATLLDAKGDLIVASAADTAARLAAAANGASLVTASGEATGLKWRLHNDGASAAPGVGDDSGDGYSIGSRWLDTTADKEYVCLDASVGAAVWKETTVSAGGVALLASVAYSPGADATVATSSGTSIADADATNLAIAFTVPASGAVLVKLSGYFDNSSAATNRWGLREASSTVAEGVVWTLASSGGLRLHWETKVTGLTPAASLTYKWAWRCSAGTGHLNAGTSYGRLMMEVWSA